MKSSKAGLLALVCGIAIFCVLWMRDSRDSHVEDSLPPWIRSIRAYTDLSRGNVSSISQISRISQESTISRVSQESTISRISQESTISTISSIRTITISTEDPRHSYVSRMASAISAYYPRSKIRIEASTNIASLYRVRTGMTDIALVEHMDEPLCRCGNTNCTRAPFIVWDSSPKQHQGWIWTRRVNDVAYPLARFYAPRVPSEKMHTWMYASAKTERDADYHISEPSSDPGVRIDTSGPVYIYRGAVVVRNRDLCRYMQDVKDLERLIEMPMVDVAKYKALSQRHYQSNPSFVYTLNVQ